MVSIFKKELKLVNKMALKEPVLPLFIHGFQRLLKPINMTEYELKSILKRSVKQVKSWENKK